MERMVTVQKKLENALVILAEDADLQERQIRLYHECLCHITLDDLPHVLRKDYYQLLTLTNMLYRSVSHLNGRAAVIVSESRQEMAAMLPATIILLHKRLTEWMAIELYLRSQRHVLS